MSNIWEIKEKDKKKLIDEKSKDEELISLSSKSSKSIKIILNNNYNDNKKDVFIEINPEKSNVYKDNNNNNDYEKDMVIEESEESHNSNNKTNGKNYSNINIGQRINNIIIYKKDLIQEELDEYTYKRKNNYYTPVKERNRKYFINNNFKSFSPKYPLHGINSRFDKTPMINVHRKKSKLINFSSDKLLDGIKEKLFKSSNNEKRLIKEKNKDKNEQINKLQKIVNNNFYGSIKNTKKRNNSIKKVNNALLVEKKENNKNNNIIVIENNTIIINKNQLTEKDIFKKDNKSEEIKIERKSIKKLKETKKVISPTKNIRNINENKNINNNINILNNFELEYKNKKGEKIIKSIREIPYMIVVNKNALNINEIKDYLNNTSISNSSLTKKRIEHSQKDNKEKFIKINDNKINTRNIQKIGGENETSFIKKKRSNKLNINVNKERIKSIRRRKHIKIKKMPECENDKDNQLFSMNINTIKVNRDEDERIDEDTHTNENTNNHVTIDVKVLQEYSFGNEDNVISDINSNNEKLGCGNTYDVETYLKMCDVLNGFNYLYQQNTQ